MTEERKQELAKNGTVQHNGKTLYLTQQAYVNNEGTDGGVCYNAHAIDEDDNEYYIAWATTKTWDDNGIRYNELTDRYGDEGLTDEELAELGNLEAYFNDESDACDWDNPSEIEER